MFAVTDGKRRTNISSKNSVTSHKIFYTPAGGVTRTFHFHGPAEEASSTAADRKKGTVARCCVTEIQGGYRGRTSLWVRPEAEIRLDGWKFPFRTDGNFATPYFPSHISAHDAASELGVGLLFSLPHFLFVRERCCSSCWSFFSPFHTPSFVLFAVLYALSSILLDQSLFVLQSLTYTAVVLALSHTLRALDTTHKTIHPKRGLEPESPLTPHLNPSKEPPLREKQRCPPSAPSPPPTGPP
jgi:hypothetical protein